MIEHFMKRIRLERRKQLGERRQLLLIPGYAHLPINICVSEDVRVRLRDATYREILRYCKFLGKRFTKRREDDPKLKEAKALLDFMQKKAKKNRGITVAEALGL